MYGMPERLLTAFRSRYPATRQAARQIVVPKTHDLCEHAITLHWADQTRHVHDKIGHSFGSLAMLPFCLIGQVNWFATFLEFAVDARLLRRELRPSEIPGLECI